MGALYQNKIKPSKNYIYYTCLEIFAHSYMGVIMYNQLIINDKARRIEPWIGGFGMIWTISGIYDHIDKYLYHNNYTFINNLHAKWRRLVPFLIVIPGFIATVYLVSKSTFIDGPKSIAIKSGIWLYFVFHSILSNYTFSKIDREQNWSTFEVSEFVTHIADIALFALLNWASPMGGSF